MPRERHIGIARAIAIAIASAIAITIAIAIAIAVPIAITLATAIRLPNRKNKISQVGTQYRTCTFRHLKDMEVVAQVHGPSDTLRTCKWSPILNY